jgi:hypothetical protein
MTVNGDLLTAAGLLLATIGLLFSAWQSEMTAALGVHTGGKRADRASRIKLVKRVLFSRALPLEIAIVVIIALSGPPAYDVIRNALTDDWGKPYDAVRAMFVGVWVLTVALGVVVGELAWRLFNKWRTLKRPDPTDTGPASPA